MGDTNSKGTLQSKGFSRPERVPHAYQMWTRNMARGKIATGMRPGCFWQEPGVGSSTTVMGPGA